VRPDSDAMRLPNRSGAPPEAGEVAWNTYLKRRVSNHDTHRGDALKASAVLPTMWYRKWELFPAAGPVVRPCGIKFIMNRRYTMKCTHPTDSPLQISSDVIAVKLVAVLYREGLINHTVYRQVTAQYSALVNPVKQ